MSLSCTKAVTDDLEDIKYKYRIALAPVVMASLILAGWGVLKAVRCWV